MADGETRVLRDSLGEVRVPAGVYWGAQTQRAVENFPISGRGLPRRFLEALGAIKAEAARVGAELGELDAERADAIARAAEEVASGALDDQFVVDVFQTGSGTSTNMNANEVIAARANELLGADRDAGPVHPNDHVNRGQSSNDVMPSALHVSVAVAIADDLLPAARELHAALVERAAAFREVLKIGRTHLQDATPMRLGQEVGAWAAQVQHGVARLERALTALRELPLGGTAVGTGLNAHPKLGPRLIERLAGRTGRELVPARDPFEAQAARDACLEVSGLLRTYASSLMKIANDVRLLGSGPRAGLGELRLPAVQPGSSIMPGKVNPVICEAVILVAAQVSGLDAAVTIAVQGAQLQLAASVPLLAADLLESVRLLAGASETFARRCVAGLEVDRERCASNVEQSLALATALAPEIGYDAAAAIAGEAHASGRSVREVARERGVLSEQELDRALDPRRQAGDR